MEETLVFIDEGFLSKLSKHFGEGKYLKINYIKFAKNISKKQNLLFKHLFYYTAPPFQETPPTEEQRKRKEGYDKFISSFSKNKEVTIREGRCQRLKIDGKFKYKQKGVDTLMTEVILYTYFERIRDSPFSRANQLINCCSRYVYLTKQDFEEAKLK